MSAQAHHQPFLTLDSVSAGYHASDPVITDLSLDIRRPGITLVEGGNGVGKSTLVEVISGYLPVLSGSVTVCGLNASSPRASQVRRICRTEPALYPAMTARDHLVFAARWAGADPVAGVIRAENYGMGQWLETEAGSLSTGNRRKLWLILCTLGDFSLVMLDEPFNGLDGDGTALLLEELTAWSGSRSVLVVAHRPPDGLPRSHRVALRPGVPPVQAGVPAPGPWPGTGG
ncbi:ABC-type multidrug transport system ATPase subunit [Arthrobacter sp. CAN_A212]|uniref:ABC transporter ATP-binding protein n=1 Tax=Arthrobacter sp. CAN_A212 TaxID=2787719 RepID=UPI0018CA0C70